MDSIAASQAVDPGSIPGQCSKLSLHPSVVFESRDMDRRSKVPVPFSHFPVKYGESMHDIAILEGFAHLNACNTCVGGIVVSIAAFQAVDPGSIPGRRNLFFDFSHRNISHLATIANFLSYSLGSAVGSASVS